ncbi:hypothetical protein COLO4_02433 [Corchorus olitorius]|uniref:Uncharacterized protein n=1 Tax=Corchorus olitorius TaxID=93759 RepID=A0A1R3L107_9ROSI|nr:hypothetical protein COLO4_02433 [Corchorus olitorius]
MGALPLALALLPRLPYTLCQVIPKESPYGTLKKPIIYKSISWLAFSQETNLQP